jgi:hypothetical protein
MKRDASYDLFHELKPVATVDCPSGAEELKTIHVCWIRRDHLPRHMMGK